LPRLSTFSIAAFDPDDGAWGVAVASKFPAVGAVVPWAKSGAGAVATQAMGNTSFGARGLEMMAAGRSAQDSLDALLADDVGREHRQVGAVDAAGQAATFTGKECLAWAGGRTGKHFAIQGNILTGPEVVDAMAQAFRSDSGDLADRLMAALLAGDRAGGDRRGRQSAALFVVKPQAGYGGFNDIWLDYRVDDDPDPVPRLVELLAIHRLYFGKSTADDQIPIAGEVATQLQRIMASLGYYGGPVSGAYDETTRSALMAFIGNENFEDRTDFAAGQIDRPVFDYLLRKFGG
jgi:uncharacterized Ntn-hydrolase superfamily protein